MRIPTPEEFFFHTPLYLQIKYEMGDEDKILDIICYNGKIDGPCPQCGKETTYKRKGQPPARFEVSPLLRSLTPFMVTLVCSRDDKHEIEFLAKNLSAKSEFVKMGQYPSSASLSLGEVKKYKKILGSKFEEYHRAIGLRSFGVGIGSFIYLRRIFESLIAEAHIKAMSDSGWNEGEYQTKRIIERIDLLKHHLPNFLVQNKSLYGIISKGVHELTEEECLAAFETVKYGIDEILNEKIHLKEAEERKKLGTELIGKLAGELNKKK